MKKIYINESQISKDLLLPKFVFDAVRSHETSLGDNPAFPSEDDYPFDYTVLKERLRDLHMQMKDVGIPLGNTDELISHLSALVRMAKDMEKPIKDSLEKLCVNAVNRLFAIPEGAVNIRCKLVDKIKYDIDVSITPEASSDRTFKFKDISDFDLSKKAVAKRRLINSLIMGASEYYASMKNLYLDDLNKLNPDLCELYDKIMTLNAYLTFVTKEEINDYHQKQGSFVEVHVGFNGKKSNIDAQGIIFPLMLHDTIKGLFELFSVYGLPLETDKAKYIISKADFLLAEPWDMRFGAKLWSIIFDRFDLAGDTNIIPYIFMELVQMPTDEFNVVMQELFMGTEKAESIMKKFIEKAKYSDGYRKFKNKIDTKNIERSMIADSYFTAAELSGYDIDGEENDGDVIIETEDNKNFEKWYRGYNSKYGSQRNHMIWITDDISYARNYGNRVEEIIIDSKKLNLAELYEVDEIIGTEFFEYYDGLSKEDAKKLLAAGYNGYGFNANSDYSYCICLLNSEPIVSRRELSREEFEAIEKYEAYEGYELIKNYDDIYD